MKYLKQIVAYIATFFLLIGCFPWSKTFKEKDITARFGTDDTGISSLLNIAGYYSSNDTIKSGLAFYKDGTIKGVTKEPFPASGISTDGVYKISNDTIYAETFWFIGMNGGMQLHHLKFKVIDHQHILLFEWADYDGTNRCNEVFKFVSSDSIPLPYTHMKQKKWMWTDKNKWKEYMNNNVRVKYWQ